MKESVTMAEEPLRGAVAAVLTDRELVINLGSERGVKPGMRFAVLNSKGLGIIDREAHRIR
jgi:cell shape-determining protein MreC